MTNRIHACFLLSLLFVSFTCLSQITNIIEADAKPQLVSGQFAFTEGPAADKQGNIFFTDQPNNNIWKYGTDGKLSLYLHGTGRSNGMYFDKKGNLVTCADEHNQLWSIGRNQKITILLKDVHGHQLNGPNDLWIDSKGGIYFTDPYFQRDYWKRKSPDPQIGGERLYYLPKGKKQPVVADSSLIKPNGVVGSANGNYLYVSDMGNHKIFKYSIEKNGALSSRQPFIDDIADGITLDDLGNLYLAGNGVTVYAPDGKKIGHIDVPSKWTANVCFGGKEKNILFMTASEAVYILPTKVHGVE